MSATETVLGRILGETRAALARRRREQPLSAPPGPIAGARRLHTALSAPTVGVIA
jgi:hypothetical protein